MLTASYSSFENQPIFEQYEPEDKESLVSLYCDVLRHMPDLKEENIERQIRKFHTATSRSGKFELAERLSKFLKVLDMEVTNA